MILVHPAALLLWGFTGYVENHLSHHSAEVFHATEAVIQAEHLPVRKSIQHLLYQWKEWFSKTEP